MPPASSHTTPDLAAIGFMDARAKLIDLAAFLDRGERHDLTADYRYAALARASAILTDGRPGRAKRVLEALSDPTADPLENADGKAAAGAWRNPAA
jgi:hypothetical protein